MIPDTTLTRLHTAVARRLLDSPVDPDGTVSVRWRDLEEVLAVVERRPMTNEASDMVEKLRTLSAYWRGEARHGDVAAAIGDDITAEYASFATTTADEINNAIGLIESLSANRDGEVERERDEARKIVQDIHWMARRYADGRHSYAVGLFNDAVRKGFDGGWLMWGNSDEPHYARDGMFDDMSGPSFRDAPFPKVASDGVPSGAEAELRAVAADMRRLMPNACGDWADRIDAAILARSPEKVS